MKIEDVKISVLLKNRTGVYAIKHISTGKIYVGSSSTCLYRRLLRHINLLSRKIHSNLHLQASWNKYGLEGFAFSVLKFCNTENCIKQEQKYIDVYRSYDRKFGYNKSPTAGSRLGNKQSEETKLKLSIAGRGRKHSKETIYRIVKANTGKKRSKNFCRRVSEIKRGTKHSEATKKRMSILHKKRCSTPEFKLFMSSVHKGRKQTRREIQARVKKLLGQKRTEKQKESIRNRWIERGKRRIRTCTKCQLNFISDRLVNGYLSQSKYCTSCRPVHIGGRYKHISKEQANVNRTSKKANSTRKVSVLGGRKTQDLY